MYDLKTGSCFGLFGVVSRAWSAALFNLREINGVMIGAATVVIAAIIASAIVDAIAAAIAISAFVTDAIAKTVCFNDNKEAKRQTMSQKWRLHALVTIQLLRWDALCNKAPMEKIIGFETCPQN